MSGEYGGVSMRTQKALLHTDCGKEMHSGRSSRSSDDTQSYTGHCAGLSAEAFSLCIAEYQEAENGS